MEIFLILIGCVLCLILFDFSFSGFLPKFLRINPAIDKLPPETILLETFFFGFKTDLPQFKNQGGRIHWKSAVLTKETFFVKLTRSTCKFKIETKDIENFTEGRNCFGRYLTLHFIDADLPRYFQFKPKKIAQWQESLLSIGIKKTEYMIYC